MDKLVLEYEKKYHSKNLLVQYRDVDGIDIKYPKTLWIVWKMIKYSCPSYKKLVYALENIYKQKYTRGSKRSRANIIISAVLIVTNPVPRLPTEVPNMKWFI